jgi:hypothetical protein
MNQVRGDRVVLVASLITALMVASGDISAQQLGSLPTVVDRSGLGLIEAEGGRYPELPPSHPDPLYWRDDVEGTSERRCVAVPPTGPTAGAIRSGDFMVTYNALWQPRVGEQHKVAWAPAENAPQMALQVRGQLMGDPAAPVVINSGLGRATRPGEPPRDDQFFFPSGVTFSKPGEWVMVATSGRNWGCFVFEVVQATSGS